MILSGLIAQSPEKMSYQAVIRNSSNQLVINKAIGMRISILQGTSADTIVYKEIYNPNPQTNANGLVSIEIGAGLRITGTFSAINWAKGPYFIETEIDPTGGTDYTVVGTSQLLSVPYTLYAKTADSIREKTHTIGESYGGGIVFFVTPDGQHGLIAETQDQSTSCYWDYAQDSISNPDNHSIAGKNYCDWRLPNEYELNLLYAQKTVVGGFACDFYWSSTTYNFDEYNAWRQDFCNGNQGIANKGNMNCLRAIRAF
jgi:hypothetical protein